MGSAFNYKDDMFIEERINGQIYLMARPVKNHLRIQYNICSIFNNYFRNKNMQCEAIFEHQFYINKDEYVVPDVIIICYDCEKDGNNGEENKETPLIIAEVLSKSTRVKDLSVKMKKYAEIGVHEYWIIDYNSRVMDIYKLENKIYELKFSCGLILSDEIPEIYDIKELEEKSIVKEFSPFSFPGITVKAEDVFYILN